MSTYTNAQANWTTVSWNSTTLTKIDSISFDFGGTVEDYSGDANYFPVLMAQLMSRPSAKIDSTDPGSLMSLPKGTAATLTATHVDAKQVTGGNIVYTMANAMLVNVSTQGSHAKFGTATASFHAFSSDGTTNPLTLTYAGT